MLAELEKAGHRYETQLKRLARNLLRQQQYTDGVIDDLLERDGVTYEDLARAAEPGGDEEPSILKGIYHDVPARDEMLAAWMASDDRDETIAAKGAVAELVKLVGSRTGLELDQADSLAKLRTIVARYVLVGEFRGDLTGSAPARIEAIPAPRTRPEIEAVNALADRLRRSHAEAYVSMANKLEAELGLATAGIAADRLGATDTFRFEERLILDHVGELIADARYEEAERLIADRERSFWLDQDVSRRAQWQACRLMVQLGQVAAEVTAAVAATHGSPDAWIATYADREAGWYRLDQAQRRLETLVASLDEEPAERPLGLVRRAYEDAARALADGFIPSLVKAGWSTAGTMHQTRVYADAVAAQPKPVAYFLVDAMRYEMGVELVERLPPSTEATITPAVAALPSITPVGMAALMPGAAASFDVVDSAGKLGSRIDGTFLPDLTARRKFAEASVPGLVDMTLAELLGTSTNKLEARLSGAQVVIVRSQEIDAAGEGGFFQARRTMDTVIDDLVRAVKKLSIGWRAERGRLRRPWPPVRSWRPRGGAAGRCARRRHRGPAPALLDRPRRDDAAGCDPRLGGHAGLRLGPRPRVPPGHRRVQGWRRPRVPPRRPDPPGAHRARRDDPHGRPADASEGGARDGHRRTHRDHEPDLQRHDPAGRTHPVDVQRSDGRPAHARRGRPPGREGRRWRSAPSWTRRRAHWFSTPARRSTSGSCSPTTASDPFAWSCSIPRQTPSSTARRTTSRSTSELPDP